jgi:hypothetical protein
MLVYYSYNFFYLYQKVYLLKHFDFDHLVMNVFLILEAPIFKDALNLKVAVNLLFVQFFIHDLYYLYDNLN